MKDHRTAWGQEFDANRQLAAELREVKGENKALKANSDALAAQVEALRNAALSAWHNWRNSKGVHGAMVELIRAVELTPADCMAQAQAERDALAAELEILATFRDEVVAVMNNSQGVVAWHLNHTIATWNELFPVVPDIQSPANCLSELRAEAGRAGYLRGLEDGKTFLPDSEQYAKWADQYANRIRQGGK